MLTMIFCLRRQAHLCREEFQAYWRERHGPLMRKNMAAFGARHYVQLHTMEGPEADFIATSRGTQPPYDGTVIVEWNDLDTFRRFNVTEDARTAGREMYKDELSFIDLENSCVYLSEPRYEVSREP